MNQEVDECIDDVMQTAAELALMEEVLKLVPGAISAAHGDTGNPLEGFFYITDAYGNMIETELSDAVRSWTVVGALIEQHIVEKGYFAIQHKIIEGHIIPTGQTPLEFMKTIVDSLTKPVIIMP